MFRRLIDGQPSSRAGINHWSWVSTNPRRHNSVYFLLFILYYFSVTPHPCGQRERWREFLSFVKFTVNLAYQSCVFLFFLLFALYVVLRTIMGGLTTEESKNLLEEALEPLRKSIDEVRKSIATGNSNYNQLLKKCQATKKEWQNWLMRTMV